jgi:hypothetical protein
MASSTVMHRGITTVFTTGITTVITTGIKLDLYQTLRVCLG